jgi:hypothetical protein
MLTGTAASKVTAAHLARTALLYLLSELRLGFYQFKGGF